MPELFFFGSDVVSHMVNLFFVSRCLTLSKSALFQNMDGKVMLLAETA